MVRCGNQSPLLTSRGKGDLAACFLHEAVVAA
jgi:hypothetical protein